MKGMSVPAAAKVVSLSEQQLSRKLRTGEIRGEKYGRDWIIPLEEMARLGVHYPLSLVSEVPANAHRP